MKKILIAPSLLGIDYGRINEAVKALEPFSDLFHVDVMDGNFVPNLSIGAMVVAKIKTKIPLDCHLMITHPEKYIQSYAKAGAYSITIHAEASSDIERDVALIKAAGCKACVAINPGTPVEKISAVLPRLNMICVMSVVPGFGGQKFMPQALPKIEWLRKNYPELDIQIDGGITEETAPLAVKAGANILVAGSYLLKSKDPAKAAMLLKKSVA